MLRAHAHGIYFTAEPATSECAGCCFDKERSSVCRTAGEAAVAAGLPDCESRGVSTHIYVRDPSDGRQQDLLIGGEA